jgi:glycosyltransferase EpsE
MSEKYRISVIMGIYNCASTLAEALDSLLAQTYQSFKVIMCDDGSKDNTMEVAQQYVDRYPGKFILIKNERNLKLAATLNHCLEYADTEYVARMDGDDLCDPTRFEKQIKFLDEHPEYAHVSTTMKLFDEDGFYGQSRTLVPVPSKAQFKNGTPYYHAPSMFRYSAFQKVNGYTAEPYVERIEDYYLWYKFHKAGLQGYNMNEPLYFMRNDKNAFARRKFSDRLRVYKVKLEVLKGLGVKFRYYYAIRDVMKGLVPSFVVRYIRKKGF